MLQSWQQIYDPLGNIWISSLIALIPIIFFFLALAVFRLKGSVAGTITVVLALLVSLFAYQVPVTIAFASMIYGFFYGLWPIAWIIIGAVFLYKISVKTGQFNIIRSSILSITEDQRLQMLLVGFAFGTFLEGAAGFGAPVAITAALLVGLGFKPLYAAGLCLIVNTAPVALLLQGRFLGWIPWKSVRWWVVNYRLWCLSFCSGSWGLWMAGAGLKKHGRQLLWRVDHSRLHNI